MIAGGIFKQTQVNMPIGFWILMIELELVVYNFKRVFLVSYSQELSEWLRGVVMD